MSATDNPRRAIRADFYDRFSRIAMDWLESFGDQFPSGQYATSHNRFLWEAESAFCAMLKDFRAAHGYENPGGPPSTGFWLYRLWTDTGRLLYVGVTRHPTRRLATHKRKWGDLIADATWEECDDAASMLAAEAKAIENECPALNIAHPQVWVDPDEPPSSVTGFPY